MAVLAQLRGRLKARQEKLDALVTEATTEDGGLDPDRVKSVDDPAGEMMRLGEELKSLGEEVERGENLERLAADSKARNEERESALSAGQEIIDSVIGDGEPKNADDIFAKFLDQKYHLKREFGGRRGEEFTMEADMKQLFMTTDGFAPESTRTGDIVMYAHRPVQLMDRIRQTPISMPVVVYMEQTVRNSPSNMGITEGSPYAEAEFEYAERTQPVVKRGAFIPVTDEQLEDVSGVRALLENDLIGIIREDVDNQLVNGNGTAPNLLGLANKTGTLTQAKGSDNVFTAVKKAMTKIRLTGRSNPDLILMHPNDWDEVVTLQATSGAYILGMPNQEFAQRMWGLPVQLVETLGANKAWVGAFRQHFYIRDRRELSVRITDQWDSANDQVRPTGRMMMWGDVRLAAVIRRAAGFCQITGI